MLISTLYHGWFISLITWNMYYLLSYDLDIDNDYVASTPMLAYEDDLIAIDILEGKAPTSLPDSLKLTIDITEKRTFPDFVANPRG